MHIIAPRLVFALFLLCLLGCVAVATEPPPPVRLATPDGPVISTELAALVTADAGAADCKPVNGCCYPPSWPSQQGACSCVDKTGKGCVWDELCPVGQHCTTLHPVLKADAGLPACGVCK